MASKFVTQQQNLSIAYSIMNKTSRIWSMFQFHIED